MKRKIGPLATMGFVFLMMECHFAVGTNYCGLACNIVEPCGIGGAGGDPGDACLFCDNSTYGGGTNLCKDCCTATNSTDCEGSQGQDSSCVWEAGECRNVSGEVCGAIVPNVPESSRFSAYIFAVLSLVGFSLLKRPRRKLL